MAAVVQNREQFKALFDEYYNALCNFCYRYIQDRDTCEDMVQTVFVRLWENRNKLELTGSLRSYLFTATRNAALDHIRSQKRKEQYLEMNPVDEYDEQVTDDTAGRLLFRDRLQKAINDLKPKTREIFMLHKMEGLTYREISEHLDIPKRTVEYNIYSALSQLKKKLQADYDKYIAV